MVLTYFPWEEVWGGDGGPISDQCYKTFLKRNVENLDWVKQQNEALLKTNNNFTVYFCFKDSNILLFCEGTSFITNILDLLILGKYGFPPKKFHYIYSRCKLKSFSYSIVLGEIASLGHLG